MRGTDALSSLVATRTRETRQLEYKARLWAPAPGSSEPDHMREAAKDVASFANSLGGDIIVGIAARASVAQGFSSWCDAGREDRARENLRDWLKAFLQPASVADHIDAVLVPAPAGAACAQVLVVTVPPSIELVGATWNRADNSVRFPVRSDDGTRWLMMDEAMMQFSLGTRAAFLRLSRCLTGNEDHVRLVSPFETVFTRPLAYAAMGRDRVPVPPQSGDHGLIGVLTENHVIFRARPWGWNNQTGAVNIIQGATLAIPLEFVRSAWRVGTLVHLALSATVLWDSQTLVLETR